LVSGIRSGNVDYFETDSIDNRKDLADLLSVLAANTPKVGVVDVYEIKRLKRMDKTAVGEKRISHTYYFTGNDSKPASRNSLIVRP